MVCTLGTRCSVSKLRHMSHAVIPAVTPKIDPYGFSQPYPAKREAYLTLIATHMLLPTLSRATFFPLRFHIDVSRKVGDVLPLSSPPTSPPVRPNQTRKGTGRVKESIVVTSTLSSSPSRTP